MDRPFPLASLAPPAVADPVRACRPVDDAADGFGAVLSEGAESPAPSRAARDDTAIAADPAVILPVVLADIPPAPPPPDRVDQAAPPPAAPQGGITPGQADILCVATGPADSASQAPAEPAVAMAAEPVAAAPAAPIGPRRARARKPAVTPQAAPPDPARTDRRASRVGWVKGGPSAAPGAARDCGQHGGGCPPAAPASGPTATAPPLSSDIVTSLRWIADPAPPRPMAMPPQAAPPMPQPAPESPLPPANTTAAEPAAPAPSPTGETELALDLAELGPVRLRIRDRRGRLALHVLADHPATLDLLRRHADELTGALQEAGLSGASLTWGRAPRPAPSTDAPSADAPSPDAPAAASPTPSASTGSPSARQPRRDGDLDLLL